MCQIITTSKPQWVSSCCCYAIISSTVYSTGRHWGNSRVVVDLQLSIKLTTAQLHTAALEIMLQGIRQSFTCTETMLTRLHIMLQNHINPVFLMRISSDNKISLARNQFGRWNTQLQVVNCKYKSNCTVLLMLSIEQNVHLCVYRLCQEADCFKPSSFILSSHFGILKLIYTFNLDN